VIPSKIVQEAAIQARPKTYQDSLDNFRAARVKLADWWKTFPNANDPDIWVNYYHAACYIMFGLGRYDVNFAAAIKKQLRERNALVKARGDLACTVSERFIMSEIDKPGLGHGIIKLLPGPLAAVTAWHNALPHK
jgi:hypothetical protein